MKTIETKTGELSRGIPNIDKVTRLGHIPGSGHVYCHIQLKNGELSITGVEGPLSDGNAMGSCGQIVMHLKADQFDEFAPDWTAERITQFLEVWDTWHLNDMRAGSEPQREWLKANPIAPEDYAYPKSHYEVASAKLSDAGLNPDANGYKYGHAWLFEPIPADVAAFLESLPDTDRKPAWV